MKLIKQGIKCIGKSIIKILQKKPLFPSDRYDFVACCQTPGEDGSKKKNILERRKPDEREISEVEADDRQTEEFGADERETE